MEIRTILWATIAGALIVSVLARFSPHEKPLPPAARMAVATPPAVSAKVEVEPRAIVEPSEDELIRTATNGAAASFALGLERQWLADDPFDDKARVSRLMLSFCDAGQFRNALALAQAAPVALQTNWLQLTFRRWAQQQPQEAMDSLATVNDPALQSAAFHAAADGWNENDPAGLAAYAMALPDSDDRIYALTAALDNWAQQDPAALGAWLNTLPRGIEFDSGAAWMVSKTDGANRSPEVAMEWVKNIGDPMLQEDSLNRVLAQWAQSDLNAARQYIASATWLDATQRRDILDSLDAH